MTASPETGGGSAQPRPPFLVDAETAKLPCAPGAWGDETSCLHHEGKPLGPDGKCIYGRPPSKVEQVVHALFTGSEPPEGWTRTETVGGELVHTPSGDGKEGLGKGGPDPAATPRRRRRPAPEAVAAGNADCGNISKEARTRLPAAQNVDNPSPGTASSTSTASAILAGVEVEPDEGDTVASRAPAAGMALPGMPRGVRVVVREDARPMRTLGVANIIWTKGENERPNVKGALVRLFPPASATDEQIAQTEKRLRDAGAEAVRTMPRPPSDLPVVVQPQDAPAPRRSIRDAVAALLEQATTGDRDALRAIVEDAIDVGEGFCPPAVRVQTGEPLSVQLLQITNWLRYRGSHALNLYAGVYGITARTPGDPAKSNWQGKSSIVEALAFLLYGWHRWPREDDWITKGENEGIVFGVLSDGTQITRRRKRGKSTQLEVIHAGETLNQDAAQTKLVELVGLSQDDFFATCFFRQKELARLVTAKPAERLAIVRGWLELDALVHAEGWAKEQLGSAIAAQGDEERQAARRRAELEQLLKTWELLPEEPASQLRSKAEALEAETVKQRALAKEREQARATAEAGADVWRRDFSQAKRAEQVSVELERAREQRVKVEDVKAKKVFPALKTKADEAFALHSKVVAEGKSKLELARGKFDGRCPVTTCPCPIAGDINADREGNAALARQAQDAVMPALQALQAARQKRDEAETTIANADALDRKIVALVKELEPLGAAVARIAKDGPPPERGTLPDPDEAWELASRADSQAKGARRAADTVTTTLGDIATHLDHAAAIGRRIATLREAVAVLGKNGAQKAIAVGELARLEQAANALLAGNGIDLSIAVRWGRESSSALATTCDACGTAFPTSQKAKVCTRCGAARGPKLDDKLELELSDRSGAAEDLAGLALQLAASGWLRERRGARWSTVVLDEPFGALDGSNSRALAVHLAGMIRGRAFRQGLVIAHSAGAMDALPGRIVVTGGEHGSTVEVLA